MRVNACRLNLRFHLNERVPFPSIYEIRSPNAHIERSSDGEAPWALSDRYCDCSGVGLGWSWAKAQGAETVETARESPMSIAISAT